MDYSLMLLGQLSSHLEKKNKLDLYFNHTPRKMGQNFKHKALARWLSCLDHHPVHQKVAGPIAGRGT